MRILDEQALKPNLASLQLEAVDLSKLERAIRQPNGMILVTGPTGSGKTTTLYSILQEINDPEINIITVEDPVEYQLARVIQINVNAEVGLTFTSGLRAILRQDPDVVLLGEIRDRETAAIAVQASLTGHLVLSTLHTNDAAGAVARLVHMGIEPYLITSSLLLAQAQRVYRRLCPFCKERTSINIAELDLSENEKDLLLEGQLFRPVGCPRCSNISYSGRRAIMEILAITDEMRDMINQGANANALRAKGITDGMRTLRSAGLSRVCQGDTSLEEILRITNHALS